MVERWLLGIACVWLSGCGIDPEVLALDTLCRGGNGVASDDICYVRFDAELTSGVASDMLGVRLGSDGGELHIRVSAIPNANRSRWSLDVLAASTSTSSILTRTLTWGSCGAVCPTDPVNVQVTLEEDFNWAQVVVDGDGAQAPRTALPPDAELILSGADIDILALRTPGFESQPQ